MRAEQRDEPWLGLVFVALAVSMIMLDTTIVNVALPWMAFDLGFATSDTQWVVAAYSLSFAALLLVAGRLADDFGRRRLLVIGTVVFVISSMLIGLSNSASAVLAGRALQGVGAAMIMPASLSLINASFTGRSRTTAFAVWGGTIGGMAAMGPLVGGWLTTYHSWHWAFFANVPISAVVIFGVLRTMPESRATHAGWDLSGALLSTIALAGGAFALIEGQRLGWWHGADGSLSVVPVAAALGLVGCYSFVAVERRRGRRGLPVLIDLDLLSIPSFRAGIFVALIVSLGEFGLLFVLPLFVQGALGYDPLQTGVLLLALAVGSFVASALGTRLPWSAVRILQLGMLLEALGIVGVGLAVSVDATRTALITPLFVYGLGIGFATAQLTAVILQDVPLDRSGQASAVQSTARQVGAAIGTAVLGAVLAVSTATSVMHALAMRGVDLERAREIATFVTDTAGQLIQFLILQPDGEQLLAGAHAGFASGTRWVSLVATAFVVAGLVASLRLSPRRD